MKLYGFTPKEKIKEDISQKTWRTKLPNDVKWSKIFRTVNTEVKKRPGWGKKGGKTWSQMYTIL